MPLICGARYMIKNKMDARWEASTWCECYIKSLTMNWMLLWEYYCALFQHSNGMKYVTLILCLFNTIIKHDKSMRLKVIVVVVDHVWLSHCKTNRIDTPLRIGRILFEKITISLPGSFVMNVNKHCKRVRAHGPT